MQPVQGELPGVTQPVDVASVVDRVTSAIAERTIDIPKIIVTPKGEVTVGYQDFDLDCSSFRQPPAEKDLLVQHLMNNQRFKIVSGDGVVVEKNLEDYIVRGLIDKDDINYDEQAELLYKLATQMVRHLQSYLQTPDDVLNVLQFYQAQIVTLIHTQMNQHYVERATEYEVTVSKGFQTLTSSMAAMQTDQEILPFPRAGGGKVAHQGNGIRRLCEVPVSRTEVRLRYRTALRHHSRRRNFRAQVAQAAQRCSQNLLPPR